MALLYDAVAAGMWAYSRFAFRVRTLGSFAPAPGTILVVTHRRETDVPVLAPALYFGGRLWADRSRRISFAARDDLFEPGLLAGFPPRLPPGLRRALDGIGVGGPLRGLSVFPLRSAAEAPLREVLAAVPEAALDELLPRASAEVFRLRALELGFPPPRRARDVLRGEFADLLWEKEARASLEKPELAPFWTRRAAAATKDFRALVELVRRGAVLVVFPEGRPSPDGAIGPVRRGLSALVRLARPERVQPIALAYDPLTDGLTLVLVAFCAPQAPPAADLDDHVLALLRRTMPLTGGQVVAHALAAGRTPDPHELAKAVSDALAEGRPVDPALADPDRLRRRFAEALAAGLAAPPATLDYLAREYASARSG